MKKIIIFSIIIAIIIVTVLSLNTSHKYKIKTEKLEKEFAFLLRKRIDDCVNDLNWYCGDKTICDSLRKKLLNLKNLEYKKLINNENKKEIENIKEKIEKMKKSLKF